MDLKRKGIEFPTPSDEDLLLVQSRQPATVFIINNFIFTVITISAE